jgi:hypothetical protein
MANEDECVHKKLLERCQAAGIQLFFDSCLSPVDLGDNADSYRPAAHGAPPMISIWRSEPEISDDVVRETITLAHEFGHHLAHEAQMVSQAHQDARRKGAEDYDFEDGPQTTNEIQLVVAEEELAWALARNTLALLGFSNWDRFERQRANSLASYTFKVLHPLFSADDAREVIDWLSDVERAIDALELNVPAKSEIAAEIATLRAQLGSSKPKPGIVVASARALAELIAEAYGSKAAAELSARWPRAFAATKPESPPT